MISKFGPDPVREPADTTARRAHDLVSVVLGRVSTEDGDRILETIAALTETDGTISCEIVIADRVQDSVSAAIARRYPAIRLIPCATGASLPEMRTLAFEASRGALVAVTEDHCVPASGWLTTATQAFANAGDDLVAVGGSVENGITDTGFDWTTFLCEYSFFSPPVAEGDSRVLPGMNVVYRRSALASVPRARMVSGFWETTVHPLLLEQGGRFVSLNAMKVYHCKRFSISLFVAQRFWYSRYYASLRFEQSGTAHRVAAAFARFLLPPVLLWRIVSAAVRKGLGPEAVRALPGLLLLVLVWSLGEMTGCLAGPGDALRRIE